jgi:uncharacterized iron-regulated membrane protein
LYDKLTEELTAINCWNSGIVNETKNLPQTEISRRKQAKTIRFFRKLHRITGLILLVFILNMAITGILLGWKKNSYDYILPDIRKGTSADLNNWLPLDSLEKAATQALSNFSAELETTISRIDIRPNQGIVKFIFENHYWGVQLDGKTAQILHIGKRRSDFLEQLHDGSFVDKFLGSNYIFKLFFTSVMGFSLILFGLSGFWIWYGPQKMRKLKKYNT